MFFLVGKFEWILPGVEWRIFGRQVRSADQSARLRSRRTTLRTLPACSSGNVAINARIILSNSSRSRSSYSTRWRKLRSPKNHPSNPTTAPPPMLAKIAASNSIKVMVEGDATPLCVFGASVHVDVLEIGRQRRSRLANRPQLVRRECSQTTLRGNRVGLTCTNQRRRRLRESQATYQLLRQSGLSLLFALWSSSRCCCGA